MKMQEYYLDPYITLPTLSECKFRLSSSHAG